MTPYQRVASLGVDPRVYWVDPDGGVREYSAEAKERLARVYDANGNNAPGGSWGSDVSARLMAAGERTRTWKVLHPDFDPKDEYMVQADGNIAERDQGINPWLLGAVVLAAPLAVAFLPGVIAGASAGGTATAGSAAAAASTGVGTTVGSAIATGSSIAIGVWQGHEQREAQQEAQQAAIRLAEIQAQQAGQSGGLFGGLSTTTLAIAAIVIVALIARR